VIVHLFPAAAIWALALAIGVGLLALAGANRKRQAARDRARYHANLPVTREGADRLRQAIHDHRQETP
jgi:hypothetical protein